MVIQVGMEDTAAIHTWAVEGTDTTATLTAMEDMALIMVEWEVTTVVIKIIIT